LQAAIDRAVADRARAIERARGVLAAAPHQAFRELAQARDTLQDAGDSLAHARERLSGVAGEIRQRGAQIQTQTRRQHAARRREYVQSANRLLREARAGHDRRSSRTRESISREHGLVSERASRALQMACRDVEHYVQLIVAQDFRRRGWLLATKAGQPVGSVSDLRASDRVQLSLRDGRADAVVQQVQADTERSTDHAQH
jgi:exonuclease VII large subunit